MKLLVTGGCGFIGSHFLRQILRDAEHSAVNFDNLTYAGRPENCADFADSPKYEFVRRLDHRQKIGRKIGRGSRRDRQFRRPSRTSTIRSRTPKFSSRRMCSGRKFCSTPRGNSGRKSSSKFRPTKFTATSRSTPTRNSPSTPSCARARRTPRRKPPRTCCVSPRTALSDSRF